MSLRRRNKVVIWEWTPSGKHHEANKRFATARGLTLLAAALGCFYFYWLYSTTGIISVRRRAIVEAEDPDRFLGVLAIIAALGAISLIAGIVKILRR